MKDISEANVHRLVWNQPRSYRMEYELRDGDDSVASLVWQKSLGSLAVAETARGRWTFKRGGFLHPHVSVRELGAGRDIAWLRVSSSGAGMLKLTSGKCFDWICAHKDDDEWAFIDAQGRSVVRFVNAHMMMDARGTVEIADAARDAPEISLLVTLGWYILILMAADAAASTPGTL